MLSVFPKGHQKGGARPEGLVSRFITQKHELITGSEKRKNKYENNQR